MIRKYNRKILKLLAVCAFAFFAFQVTGCATLTEDEKFDREYNRYEKLLYYKKNYDILSQKCRANGQTVFMAPKVTTRIRREYTWENYAFAWCG